MLGLVRLDDRPPLETAEFWLVCFHEGAAAWWAKYIPGRFKHVSVIGFYREAKSWVLVDPALHGMRIGVYADTNGGLNALGEWIDDALVVRMPSLARDARVRVGAGRAGYWCVPVARHLVGVRSGALLPDTLLRDCLKAGGTIAAEPGDNRNDEDAETAGGSGTGSAEGGIQGAEA